MKNIIFPIIIIVSILAFKKNPQQVDLILHNGIVYTVDSAFSINEAFAVKRWKNNRRRKK